MSKSIVTEKQLSFREKIQRFITHHRATKHPIILVIIAVLLVAAIIVIGVTTNETYTDPSTVTLNRPADTAVQMSFAGDIMLGRQIAVRGEKEGYDVFFEKTSALWKDSDIVMGNLENVAIKGSESDYEKSADPIILSSTPESVTALKDAGFNLIGLANNHFCNLGREGMISSFEIFEENNLEYLGAGYNIEEAARYAVKEIGGFKIGIIAGTEVSGHGTLAGDDYPGSLSMLYTRFYDVIDSAASECDFTVVFMHWGDENILSPTEEMKEIGKKLIDAGADAIIGMHPHVLLPVEKYRDGIICYSLGNFVFDQGKERQTDSTLLNYTITEDGEGQLEFVPLKIVNGAPQIATSKSDIKRINHFLTKGMDASDYKTTDDGHIIISAPGVNLEDVEARKIAEAEEQAKLDRLKQQASTEATTAAN